jgi:N-acetylmuramoyl-L-alanine amidase
MIPIRFVSLALGIPDTQISWDNEKRAVTIINGSRVIQFKVGSSDLIINGVTTTMYSPDDVPRKVTAEVKDDRCFIPFRALGYALGVSVGWDNATKTAIFNADMLDGYES